MVKTCGSEVSWLSIGRVLGEIVGNLDCGSYLGGQERETDKLHRVQVTNQ